MPQELYKHTAEFWNKGTQQDMIYWPEPLQWAQSEPLSELGWWAPASQQKIRQQPELRPLLSDRCPFFAVKRLELQRNNMVKSCEMRAKLKQLRTLRDGQRPGTRKHKISAHSFEGAKLIRTDLAARETHYHIYATCRTEWDYTRDRDDKHHEEIIKDTKTAAEEASKFQQDYRRYSVQYIVHNC